MTAANLARGRAGNLIGAIASAALIGYALYAQYVLHLDPCPLCIFQRVAVIVVGVLFLIAAIHDPGRIGARVYAGAILVAALGGIGVAARQIWIQAQPPGSVAACGAGLDYMLEIMPVMEVIKKVLTGSGECAKIDRTFLGLSMPWWVLFSLVALAAWALIVNRGKRVRTLSFR